MKHGGLDAVGAHHLQQRLHDGLGQCLSLAVMQIDEMASASEAEALQRARALLLEALQEVRALIGSIGEPATAGTGTDLPNRLHALVRHLNGQQAIPVNCTIDGPPLPVPEPACGILLGAARELLVNACKHGHATTVEARLSTLPHRLSITVMQCQSVAGTLPTPRATPPSFGMGLPATRERLGLIGARLRWRDSPAGGVQARIHWVPQ